MRADVGAENALASHNTETVGARSYNTDLDVSHVLSYPYGDLIAVRGAYVHYGTIYLNHSVRVVSLKLYFSRSFGLIDDIVVARHASLRSIFFPLRFRILYDIAHFLELYVKHWSERVVESDLDIERFFPCFLRPAFHGFGPRRFECLEIKEQ